MPRVRDRPGAPGDLGQPGVPEPHLGARLPHPLGRPVPPWPLPRGLRSLGRRDRWGGSLGGSWEPEGAALVDRSHTAEVLMSPLQGEEAPGRAGSRRAVTETRRGRPTRRDRSDFPSNTDVNSDGSARAAGIVPSSRRRLTSTRRGGYTRRDRSEFPSNPSHRRIPRSSRSGSDVGSSRTPTAWFRGWALVG
jgi:hypothetical protein